MPVRTIESVVEIQEDRRMVVQLPADVPLGKHRVVTVLDERIVDAESNKVADWMFPVLKDAQWPHDMPLTREEMYDGDGR
ncbi:MAG: hypothetical protein ACT4QC_07860 [Planctomycetaceae bacterium]